MNNEHIEWSRSHWFGGRKDNTSEKFKCPIDFIEALVATTEPSLIETISKMANEVDTMRNMPEHIFLDIGSTDIENDGNNWDRVNKCYKRFEKYYADAFSIIKSRIWKRNTK